MPPVDLYGEILAPGALVGLYEINQLAYEGGFAAIYRASHLDTGDAVAVKVLRRSLAESLEVVQRFHIEAEAIRRIDHRNVIDVFEISDLTDGRPYMVMEWLDGRNLAEMLEERGPFAPGEALAIMREVGSALAAAHALGVVHRDVKAQNIIAVPDGTWFSLKLIDFGIAKLTAPEGDSFALSSRIIMGTPQTMAPEQILGNPVDPRTDVYALGVLLYQLVTGQMPYNGINRVEIEEMHLRGAPPRASDIAPQARAFDEIIQRSMSKAREARHATTGDLVADLEAAMASGALLGLAHELRGAEPALATETGIGLQARARTGPVPGDTAALAEQLDWIDEYLETARDRISAAGLAIHLDSADTVLGVAILPGDDRALREQAIAAALAIAAWQEAHQSGATSAIDTRVSLHMAPVSVRRVDGHAELIDGDLLDTERWPAPPSPGSLAASPAVLAGLEASYERRIQPAAPSRRATTPKE